MALQLMTSGLNNNTRCIMPPCPMEGDNRARSLALSNTLSNSQSKILDLILTLTHPPISHLPLPLTPHLLLLSQRWYGPT